MNVLSFDLNKFLLLIACGAADINQPQQENILTPGSPLSRKNSPCREIWPLP
jgi:hypothetical protein